MGTRRGLPSPQSWVPFLAYFCYSPLLGILPATCSLANYGSFSKTQFRPIPWLSNSLPFPKSPPHTPREHCYWGQSTMCLLLSQRTWGIICKLLWANWKQKPRLSQLYPQCQAPLPNGWQVAHKKYFWQKVRKVGK